MNLYTSRSIISLFTSGFVFAYSLRYIGPLARFFYNAGQTPIERGNNTEDELKKNEDGLVQSAFLEVGKALEKAFIAFQKERLSDVEMRNFRSAVYHLEASLTASGGRGQVYIDQISFPPKVQRAMNYVRSESMRFRPINTVADLLGAKFYRISDISGIGFVTMKSIVETLLCEGLIPSDANPEFVAKYPVTRAGSKTFLQVILESIPQGEKDGK